MSGDTPRTRVTKLKWDGSVSSERPALIVRCRGGRIVWTTEDRQGRPVMSAARSGHWWLATFDGSDRRRVAIDVCTPLRVGSDGIRFVDLDLDLVGRLPGPLSLEDVADFKERIAALGYPGWIQAGAWRGIEDAQHHVSLRRWPFDETIIPAL